jgi:hypothetical protein
MYEKINFIFFIIISSNFIFANKKVRDSSSFNYYHKIDPIIKGKKYYPYIKTNKFEGAPTLPMLDFSDIDLPKEYIVQSGDTLFSICNKFLNTGRIWPKLWAINIDTISNPHILSPGIIISFREKYVKPIQEIYIAESTLNNTESEEINEKQNISQEQPIAPIAIGQKQKIQKPNSYIEQKSTFPDSTDTQHDKLKDLVSWWKPLQQRKKELPYEGYSFSDPVLQLNKNGFIDDAAGLNRYLYDIEKKVESYDAEEFYDYKLDISTNIVLPGLVLNDELPVLCVIRSSDGFGEFIIQFRNVICEMKDTLKPTNRYLIVRKKSISFWGSRNIYFNVGTIVIDKINTEEQLAKGHIISYGRDLRDGDYVVDFLDLQRSVSSIIEDINYSNSSVKILSFSQENHDTAAAGDFVFLNGGKDKGLYINNIYPIYKSSDSSDRKEYTKYSYFSDKIGYIRILDVREEGSVGYIMETNAEVFVGDTVGTKG